MAAIESCGFGRVTIDGREETRDHIVLPDRVVRRWWRQDGHRRVLEDLDEVLDELPERLLVGTGAYRQMRPDPSTLEALSARGINIEVLSTAQAVRRYSHLDPRKTAATRRRKPVLRRSSGDPIAGTPMSVEPAPASPRSRGMASARVRACLRR